MTFKQYKREMEELEKLIDEVKLPASYRDMLRQIVNDTIQLVQRNPNFSRMKPRQRWKVLKQNVNKIAKDRFKEYEDEFISHIANVVEEDAKRYGTIMHSYFRVDQAVMGVAFIQPQKIVSDAIQRATLGKSRRKLIRDFIDNIPKNVANSLVRDIKQMYMTNESKYFDSASETMAGLLSDRTGIPIEELRLSRRVLSQTKTLQRTIIGVAKEDIRDQYDKEILANTNMVSGWYFDAHIDNRTSQFCMEHNGEFFPIDKYPTRQSIPYGAPPYHWNCRTVVYMVPSSKRVK